LNALTSILSLRERKQQSLLPKGEGLDEGYNKAVIYV